jgi:hypothetical protein
VEGLDGGDGWRGSHVLESCVVVWCSVQVQRSGRWGVCVVKSGGSVGGVDCLFVWGRTGSKEKGGGGGAGGAWVVLPISSGYNL